MTAPADSQAPLDIEAEAMNKPKPVKVRTPVEVARAWKGNPLVHQPTGLARLDDLTGGGSVFGSRWYVLGHSSGSGSSKGRAIHQIDATTGKLHKTLRSIAS